MAEKKEEKGGGGDHEFEYTIEGIIFILFGLYLLYLLIRGIFLGVSNYVSTELSYESPIRRLFADFSLRNLRRLGETSYMGAIISALITAIKYALYGLTAFFIFLAVKFYMRTKALTDNDEKSLVAIPAGYIPEEDPMQKRWKKITTYSQSDNPSDWRLAILEADIILDEILDINGYHGETVGDRLKAIEKADMPSLDMAWEAHKIRNAIAHQGESFVLTPREARRVIDLYKQVFRDFKVL